MYIQAYICRYGIKFIIFCIVVTNRDIPKAAGQKEEKNRIREKRRRDADKNFKFRTYIRYFSECHKVLWIIRDNGAAVSRSYDDWTERELIMRCQRVPVSVYHK